MAESVENPQKLLDRKAVMCTLRSLLASSDYAVKEYEKDRDKKQFWEAHKAGVQSALNQIEQLTFLVEDKVINKRDNLTATEIAVSSYRKVEVTMAFRRDCPMRHPDNGNCTVAGGFCTAVSDQICEALQNAYHTGSYDTFTNIKSGAYEPLTLKELENMLGEKIWVMPPGDPGYGRWAVVGGVDFDENKLILVDDFSCCDYGEVWVAYRKRIR